MEKVAFVILHYNVPETTRQCVASVRALKCRVIKKIVIVDNGSPDGSGRILAADYAKDPDITVWDLQREIMLVISMQGSSWDLT